MHELFHYILCPKKGMITTMKSLKIAAQLYTLRDYLKTPEDLAISLKKVKDIGYDAIQISGIGNIDSHIVKDIAHKEGLTICATHIPFQRLKDAMESVISQHKLWGCKYVGIGAMPQEYQLNKETYIAFAKEASEYGKILLKNGLQLIYHNHNFEFKKFNGTTGIEILFHWSDPEAFNFEIDTYWVQAGGANPIDYIKKMKGRLSVVHLKDMVIGSDNQVHMAEIGRGNLNWPAILEACEEYGVEWCPVEQDICEGDPFTSLQISKTYLESL